MHDDAPSVLTAWSNFYVITGSSAAALTGLVFVVITLVAGGRAARTTHEGVATFTTPTIVHFCTALLVSATLSAPWRLLLHPAVVLTLTGLYGIVYVLRVMFRTRRQQVYVPDIDDWVWYCILPLLANATIVAFAIVLARSAPAAPLFALAAATLLLIFIGIHNAWDVVTYIAIDLSDQATNADRSDEH